ncbi:diaminopimelate decarboxylase, aspartate kinase (fusion of lysA and lysC) [Legionella geestiana]|uniref:Aspartokinase n=1 Tax=Legionella geestiana TaxID=45065 RepID=A0A0W0TGP1_9GAMM|nr:aspartate kinase [Legionella geestiana]KTC94745.1 diaminopimelate decarboxylase, aspartate kinase (fusion of lysA and lysC) [Legionella geestiana]QBS12700.1 aspartate kinase [Legionella geestiana]QDQ39583.1 aspartate kinase [Legionella geestiana]STX54834.1 diaminopimelate decarboxylase, aspartate kinase (fusion of lysA and lysC) [Legionella geestiana]
MALFVQKFGGTSLATLTHINHAADIVAKARQAGHDVVVIVSAMSGETDRLIALANQISESPSEREYAALVSTGELVSMALMALALQNRGIDARSYSGAQARIQTCSQFRKARIRAIDTQPIQEDLRAGRVVVIAGFQGVDKNGNVTTLGRGGSDTTAVAIAAALKADECQIYTDVDGVYTTDPSVVPEARRLERITFEEMLELASLGAKVLQIRAVEFAGKYNVPLRVLSSSQEGPGTLITYEEHASMESPLVRGIAYSRSEGKIALRGIPDAPGVASTIMKAISAIGVNADMIVQQITPENTTDFTFTVHIDEYELVLKHLRHTAKALKADSLSGEKGIAKLSIVGAGLKSHPEVATRMFDTLAAEGINIQRIATSEIRISVMIDAALLEKGVYALHKAFCLEGEALDETPATRSPRVTRVVEAAVKEVSTEPCLTLGIEPGI